MKPPLLLALPLLAACAGDAERPPSAGDAPPDRSEPARTTPPNAFSPDSAGVGDVLLGLRLVALDAARAVAVDSSWTGTARFAGEVALSGRLRAHPDAPENDSVCLDLDVESAARLPVFVGETRRPWLCFDDAAGARALLPADAAPGTPVTVVVDDYAYTRSFTDAVNTARLVRMEREGGGEADGD